MCHPRFRSRLLLHPGRLWVLATIVALLLVIASSLIFSKWTTDPFLSSFASTLIDLAVIGILGTAFSQLLSVAAEVRTNEAEERERRLDFLRRLRTIHVRVATAQKLLRVHPSAAIYQDQHHELMSVVPALDEIKVDLEEAPDLFGNEQPRILWGIRKIIAYLDEGGEEFAKYHSKAENEYDYAYASQLADLDWSQNRLAWTIDFAMGGPQFQTRYVGPLTESKGRIRSQVFKADRHRGRNDIVETSYDILW